MDYNSQDFSIEDAARLAATPAAQQLIAALQEKNPEVFQQAASGDYDAVRKNLAKMLSSPEVQALLRQLGG